MVSDNSDLTDKQVYTTGEAADICKISQQTIIRCFDRASSRGSASLAVSSVESRVTS